MVQANAAGEDASAVIADTVGWAGLRRLAATAATLTGAIEADPLDHLASGHAGHALLRRYAPRMLDALPLRGGTAAAPLLAAVETLRAMNRAGRTARPGSLPLAFARPKWRERLVVGRAPVDPRAWETAVLFSLRAALRSGDVWLAHSRRHREPERELVPVAAVRDAPRLAVPLNTARRAPMAGLRAAAVVMGSAQLAPSWLSAGVVGATTASGRCRVAAARRR